MIQGFDLALFVRGGEYPGGIVIVGLKLRSTTVISYMCFRLELQLLALVV